MPFSGAEFSMLYDGSNPASGLRPYSSSSNKRQRGNLPKWMTVLLRDWMKNHLEHPYPTEEETQELVAQTGLKVNQVSNWFINARRQHWQRMKKAAEKKEKKEKKQPSSRRSTTSSKANGNAQLGK